MVSSTTCNVDQLGCWKAFTKVDDLYSIMEEVGDIVDIPSVCRINFQDFQTKSKHISIILTQQIHVKPSSHIYLRLEDVTHRRSLQCLVDTCTSIHTIPCEVFLNNLAEISVTAYGLIELPTAKKKHFEICSRGNLITKGLLPEVPLAVQLVQHFSHHDLTENPLNNFDIHVHHKPPSGYTVMKLTASCPLLEMFIIQVFQKSASPAMGHIFFHDARHGPNFQFPHDLIPASDYMIQVEHVFASHYGPSDHEVLLYTLKVSYPLRFRAYMTKAEVQELYIKGHLFSLPRNPFFAPISHMYRNKWYNYFIAVFCNDGGLMVKYDKNWSGDKASTLHHNIQGLFFSTAVDPTTLQPPASSYYGPVRLCIPAYKFLQTESSLYFADFYCHYVNHKVTVVITQKGSNSDNFCKERLLELNKRCNPFLFIDHMNNVFVTQGLIVEVFFTESINVLQQLLLDPGVSVTHVTPIGTARNTVQGIPKRQECDICNLEAVKARRKR